MLDNCEHLLDEVAGFVEDVLDGGPNARILVTSREALGIPGEQGHRLPSLDDKSSLALLVARATEASDSFRLGRGDEIGAVELCRQLDGMPLALELAAPHLVYLSPAELLQRLDDRFQLLVGSARGNRQRQQTLQTVMEWSWDLLSEDERRVLASLSVFVGGWTLDAAEGVARGLAGAPVAALLAFARLEVAHRTASHRSWAALPHARDGPVVRSAQARRDGDGRTGSASRTETGSFCGSRRRPWSSDCGGCRGSTAAQTSSTTSLRPSSGRSTTRSSPKPRRCSCRPPARCTTSLATSRAIGGHQHYWTASWT